jgi:DNA-binding NtrC family response regulator
MRLLKIHHWPGNVRELRNLVESMVVLAPGGEIQASDIPPEIRGTDRRFALVPFPARHTGGEDEGRVLRPELEFVFRTLVEMRVDMDQLRREFDAYQQSLAVPVEVAPQDRGLRWRFGGGEALGSEETVADALVMETPRSREVDALPTEPPRARDLEPEEGVVVYRPGMTMEDLEREAIRAALAEVGGNRRKAAERLQIGERTLYRKIQRFGLDA